MTKESETLRVSGSIQHFEIIRGEKVGPDYGAYAIVIVTDRGKWRISGCHDTGPELMEVNDLRFESDSRYFCGFVPMASIAGATLVTE